jgi:hypothetical protein
LTPIDSYKKSCLEGIAKEDSVKVNVNEGFRVVTIQDYLRISLKMNPNILVPLTETPYNLCKLNIF